jgi:hypothetical protein
MNEPGVLLIIATLKLSRDYAIAAWLCLGAFSYGYGVYKFAARYRRRPMTVLAAMLLGVVLGTSAGLIASLVFPPDDSPATSKDKLGDETNELEMEGQ